MKLVIDIPQDYYEIIKHDVEHHLTQFRTFEIIGNGIPLDDIKAEIKNDARGYRCDEFVDGMNEVLEIIDNIGKESKE